MELKVFKSDSGHWRYDSDNKDFLIGTHRIEIVIDVSDELHQVTMTSHQYAMSGNVVMLDETDNLVTERWAYPIESLVIKTKDVVKESA